MEELCQCTTVRKTRATIPDCVQDPTRTSSGKDWHSNATWNDSGEGFDACAHWTHLAIPDKIITLRNFIVSGLIADITLQDGTFSQLIFFGYMILWFFRGSDGSRGREEGEEKESKRNKNRRRTAQTTLHHITSHTLAHLIFLSTPVLFLMVHDTLLIVFGDIVTCHVKAEAPCCNTVSFLRTTQTHTQRHTNQTHGHTHPRTNTQQTQQQQ